MSGHLILSCPFCHHKAEYRDAPPNSTVRCHECSSVFRVPANALAKHRPGTVIQGEQKEVRRGSLRWLVILVLLGVIGGTGWYLYEKVLKPAPVVGDPYADIAQYKLDAPYGVGALERFLLAWKDPKLTVDQRLDRMLMFCCEKNKTRLSADAPEDKRKEFRDWMKSTFGDIQLKSFTILNQFKPIGQDEFECIVNLEAEDTRTSGSVLKGGMSPRVVKESTDTPEGKHSSWCVEIESATPRWDY